MSKGRVVAVIVEGTTDATTLRGPMEMIFQAAGQLVRFKAVGEDVTSDRRRTDATFKAPLEKCITEMLSSTGLHKSDLSRILHLVDLDGAFIPQTNVLDNWQEKGFFYGADGIHASNAQDVMDRNTRKARRINLLLATQSLLGIPYSLYYMSQNLEHVVADVRNCPSREKRALAKEKAIAWQQDPSSFVDLVTDNDHGCKNWIDSWNYVRSGMHSLERGTNLRFAFPAGWEKVLRGI